MGVDRRSRPVSRRSLPTVVHGDARSKLQTIKIWHIESANIIGDGEWYIRLKRPLVELDTAGALMTEKFTLELGTESLANLELRATKRN